MKAPQIITGRADDAVVPQGGNPVDLKNEELRKIKQDFSEMEEKYLRQMTEIAMMRKTMIRKISEIFESQITEQNAMAERNQHELQRLLEDEKKQNRKYRQRVRELNELNEKLLGEIDILRTKRDGKSNKKGCVHCSSDSQTFNPFAVPPFEEIKPNIFCHDITMDIPDLINTTDNLVTDDTIPPKLPSFSAEPPFVDETTNSSQSHSKKRKRNPVQLRSTYSFLNYVQCTPSFIPICPNMLSSRVLTTSRLRSNESHSNKTLEMKQADDPGYFVAADCIECNESFTDFRQYYDHLKCHFQNDQNRDWLMCKECDSTKKWPRGNQFVNHLCRDHGYEYPFRCRKCKHMTVHKGEMMMHLSSCRRKGKRRKRGKHIQIKTPTKKKIKDCHPLEQKGFTVSARCKECDSHFNDYTLYWKHLRTHFDEDGDREWRRCRNEVCDPIKTFQGAHDFVTHLCSKIHGYAKPFQCSFCVYTSARSDRMRQHIVKVHSGKEQNKLNNS